MTTQPLRGTVAVSACVLFISTVPFAQVARSVQDGVYTDAQAARGQAVYAARCASCHGDALNGAQGPPLKDDLFLSSWLSEKAWEHLTTLVDHCDGERAERNGQHPHVGGQERSDELRRVHHQSDRAHRGADAAANQQGRLQPLQLGNDLLADIA